MSLIPRTLLRTEILASLVAAAFASHALLAVPAGAAERVAEDNTCESCHKDSDFLVTNKKLYDYYLEWSDSVHRQEEVTCDDCHGGDAAASDKVASHADGVAATDPDSGIHYTNIVDTCGTCHDDVLEGFRKSNHFEHIVKKEGEAQGPTCVTCHGSINSQVLNVNSVADACARCHNEEKDNHPDVPRDAKSILNRFLSINRFYRYIAIRAEPMEAMTFFKQIDPKMKHLSVTWHSFDLEKIDEETREVLSLLSAKRDEIRARQKTVTKGK